ncbi:MAG: CopG family transcriptional regulator [Euryarchaeota archaeon]|nr:CopG family transcriptional regulator [Euryarchaeota archaeon]
MRKKKEAMKRIQVTFTKEQWELIEKLKGEMGITDSEIVRNIVMGWLMEKSFISTTLKTKLFKNGVAKKDDRRIKVS